MAIFCARSSSLFRSVTESNRHNYIVRLSLTQTFNTFTPLFQTNQLFKYAVALRWQTFLYTYPLTVLHHIPQAVNVVFFSKQFRYDRLHLTFCQTSISVFVLTLGTCI